MAVIQSRRAPQVPAAGNRAPEADHRRRRSRGSSGGSRLGRRAGHRLWAVLNAQALLSGTAGTPGGVLPAEDDWRRLAARRAG